MRRCWIYYLLLLFLATGAYSCSKDNTQLEPEPTPAPDPMPEPTPSEDAIYNGIVLPEQWPPKRSYSSEIRKGMFPFY